MPGEARYVDDIKELTDLPRTDRVGADQKGAYPVTSFRYKAGIEVGVRYCVVRMRRRR